MSTKSLATHNPYPHVTELFCSYKRAVQQLFSKLCFSSLKRAATDPSQAVELGIQIVQKCQIITQVAE